MLSRLFTLGCAFVLFSDLLRHGHFVKGQDVSTSLRSLGTVTNIPTSPSSIQSSLSSLSSTVNPNPSSSIASRCTAPNSPMKTITFVYDGNRMKMSFNGSNAGTMMPAAPDGIMWNMCRGIETSTGTRNNSVILTAADHQTQITNRKRMCQIKDSSWCQYKRVQADLSSYISQSMPESAKTAIRTGVDLSCSEFPFARTVEGGDQGPGFGYATSMCVPRSDLGWQGATMADYFCGDSGDCGDDKIHNWCNFVVEIVGWDCALQQPTRRKMARTLEQWGDQLTEDYLYRNYDASKPGLNLLSMPLGDFTDGSYTVNLDIKSGNFSTQVVSYDGTLYRASPVSHGQVNFTLTESVKELSLVATTFDHVVDLNYSAVAVRGTINGASRLGAFVPSRAMMLMELLIIVSLTLM